MKIKRILLMVNVVLVILCSVACGDNKNSSVVETQEINYIETIEKSVDNTIKETTFTSLSREEQVTKLTEYLESIKSEDGTTYIVEVGSIKYEETSDLIIYRSINGEVGEIDLSTISYKGEIEDNLVWQGEEPVIGEKPASSQSGDSESVNNENSDTEDADTEEYGILPEKDNIVALKLNYDKSKLTYKCTVITTRCEVYYLDMSGRDMTGKNLQKMVENIIRNQVSTHQLNTETVEDLYLLGRCISSDAELDSEHYGNGLPTEVIYGYSEEDECLIECASRGDYNNTLEDENAQEFVIGVYNAIDLIEEKE